MLTPLDSKRKKEKVSLLQEQSIREHHHNFSVCASSSNSIPERPHFSLHLCSLLSTLHHRHDNRYISAKDAPLSLDSQRLFDNRSATGANQDKWFGTENVSSRLFHANGFHTRPATSCTYSRWTCLGHTDDQFHFRRQHLGNNLLPLYAIELTPRPPYQNIGNEFK